jgi:hypothetical protein
VARRFVLVANLPDDLEMFLADHKLGVSSAAASPPPRSSHSPCAAVCCAVAQSSCHQRASLASLTSQQLDAAASASAAAVKAKLCEVQELLHKISVAEERLKEQLVNTKYQIRQMDVGSTDDFHKGLADRIGRRAFALRCVHLLIAGVGRVAQSRL